MTAWRQRALEVQATARLTVQALHERWVSDRAAFQILDVRERGEVGSRPSAGSAPRPLSRPRRRARGTRLRPPGGRRLRLRPAGGGGSQPPVAPRDARRGPRRRRRRAAVDPARMADRGARRTRCLRSVGVAWRPLHGARVTSASQACDRRYAATVAARAVRRCSRRCAPRARPPARRARFLTMSDSTPFEPRPDSERSSGRRRFQPARRRVLQSEEFRRGRPRGCQGARAVRRPRSRRRLVTGCPRGR